MGTAQSSSANRRFRNEKNCADRTGPAQPDGLVPPMVERRCDLTHLPSRCRITALRSFVHSGFMQSRRACNLQHRRTAMPQALRSRRAMMAVSIANLRANFGCWSGGLTSARRALPSPAQPAPCGLRPACCTRLRKIDARPHWCDAANRSPSGSMPAMRHAPGAAAGKPCRVEIDGIGMVAVHVLDDVRLRVDQRRRAGDAA